MLNLPNERINRMNGYADKLYDLSQTPIGMGTVKRTLGVPNHFRPVTERPPKDYRETRLSDLKMDQRIMPTARPDGVDFVEHVVMGRPQRTKSPDVFKLEVSTLLKPSNNFVKNLMSGMLAESRNPMHNERKDGLIELDGKHLYMIENVHGEVLLLDNTTGKINRTVKGDPVGLMIKE